MSETKARQGGAMPQRPGGGMGGPGMMGRGPVEKPKDFKKTMKTLITYLSPYRMTIIAVMVIAMATNINDELAWLESKANSIKEYVDANPYHEVEDRTNIKYDKFGNSYDEVVQKIEAIHKSLREAMRDYALLLSQIDKLREEEKRKEVEARGGKELNSRQKRFVDK